MNEKTLKESDEARPDERSEEADTRCCAPVIQLVSICNKCKKARNPASDTNTKDGWVGCGMLAVNENHYHEGYIENCKDSIIAKEIGYGWIDASHYGKPKSGNLINFMILTKETTTCKGFDAV